MPNAPISPEAEAPDLETHGQIESERLWLPSDWTEDERITLGLSGLADCERELREAEVHEYLNAARSSVKVISAMSNQKKIHARGQAQNTRALSSIKEEEKRRDQAVIDYNSAREALLRLLPLEERRAGEERLPVLSVQDTYRKPPQGRREVGDSRRRDGSAWRIHKDVRESASTSLQLTNDLGTVVEGNKNPMLQGDEDDGWIWRTTHRGKMSDTEYEEWELAGEQEQDGIPR
jgi:hypothetical protein